MSCMSFASQGRLSAASASIKFHGMLNGYFFRTTQPVGALLIMKTGQISRSLIFEDTWR